jgi:dihydroorotate dehydrogenase (fumarate)
VDGLELNLYFSPSEIKNDPAQIEKRQLDIIREVKRNVKLPVSLKLS